jgi:hypothetical protein
MKRRTILASAAIFVLTASAAYAAVRFSVRTGEFDPSNTFLVQAEWLSGIGCPTSARTTVGTYTDGGCPTGDASDRQTQGLLLAKTGPTANNASAFAVLQGVQGTALTELGYDLRKPGGVATDSRGSHCGAGAPRFNVTTQDGTTYFIGCNSPSAIVTNAGVGWMRLRWGGGGTLSGFSQSTGALVNISGMTVRSISIVFDEGQDTGPDNFGLAVLDNIDVNGTLVGRGENPTNNRGNGGNGDNDNGDENGDDHGGND